MARAAGVSRQWLYQQPQIRAEIERQRSHLPHGPGQVAAAQRTSDASLRQRNRGLLDEHQRLRAENAKLKNELAIVYAERRASPDPT